MTLRDILTSQQLFLEYLNIFLNISLHLNMFQSHTLEDLAVFTQYLVSLRVFNPEGAGPDTIVVVMTDEGGEQHTDTHISDIFGP